MSEDPKVRTVYVTEIAQPNVHQGGKRSQFEILASNSDINNKNTHIVSDEWSP